MHENTTSSWPNHVMGKVVLNNEKRDAPSWSRLAALESEMEELRGKVAILERNQDDFEAALARVLRAMPAGAA